MEVKKFLLRLSRSVFVRNVILIMSSSALAQIIGFGLTPLISRLFTPSDFGVFGSFYSVVTIVASLSTFEYTQAVMLPRQKEDAINIFCLACISTVGLAALCSVIILIAPDWINNVIKSSDGWVMAFCVMYVLSSGFNRACISWSVRSKAFFNTAASNVLRSVSANGSRIGFGYYNAGAIGLIISSVLGELLASINLIRLVRAEVVALRKHIRWKRIVALAREYRDFPMYSAPQNFTNALSSGLPVLLLTQYYGIEIAGAYAFAHRLLRVPMGLLIGSLRQVLFQRVSELEHNGQPLVTLYFKTTIGLFSLSVVPTIIMLVWAPQIFSLVFGRQWLLAGQFAQSLIIWIAVVLFNTPAVLFARVIRKQKAVFIYDLLLLAARTLVLVLGGSYLTANTTVFLFAAVGAVMNFALIVMVGYLVVRREGTRKQSVTGEYA